MGRGTPPGIGGGPLGNRDNSKRGRGLPPGGRRQRHGGRDTLMLLLACVLVAMVGIIVFGLILA